MKRIPILFVALLAGGCSFDEGIIVENMAGTVVLPPEALTRSFVDASGAAQDPVTDVRLVGPVYLGLYSGVAEGVEAYPSPLVGPQITPGVPGDTYPYGGTTVGNIRFSCLEFLTCKVVSGRYVDWDHMVDWFADTLQTPIQDQFGNPVDNGAVIQQTCYDLLHVTSDREVRLTAYDDKNADGKIDDQDLDFVERNDGMYEAPFTIWQQEWFDNAEQVARDGGPEADVHGFSLWGWMDAPSNVSFQYTTCDGANGFDENTYNNDFQGGRPYQDVLNQPSTYITAGDWVASEGFVYENWYDAPELRLDFEVQ